MSHRIRNHLGRRFRDLSLIRKIMFIYISISALPILILGIALVSQEGRTLRISARSAVRQTLMQSTAQMLSDIRVYDNLANYIAYNQSVSDVLSSNYNGRSFELYEQLNKTVDPILTSPTYFSHGINGITIYVDRDIPEHGDSIAPLSSIKDKKWYRDNRADFGAASVILIDKKEDKVRLVRTMPLMEQNGVNGILCLELDYNDFFGEYKDICGKGQGLFVFNKDGEAIYRAGEAGKIKNSGAYFKRETYDGHYIVKRRISGTGLTAAIYTGIGFSPAQHKTVILAFLAYIAIVASTLYIASVLFNHYVVEDISALGKNMVEVGKGNRTLTVKSDSADEIGDLIRGFGSMLDEENVLIKENYENKLALRKSEMKALQAQINPHFLYNSLSLINWKAIEVGADDISSITLALSNFYRTSLNRGKNVLTIEKEIENVKSYIAIQLYMHDNSFDTVIDIDEEILPYETLNLILQPLVENAIDHGIDMKESGRGYIKIIGRQDQDTIVLTVSDDGVGMDEETAEKITTFKSHGYGLANVNERIKLFYGEKYGVKVKSRVGFGTICTITIPKIHIKDKNQT